MTSNGHLTLLKRHLRTLWFVLALALLALAGIIGFSLQQQHEIIDVETRGDLINQIKVIDENLTLRLIKTNSALDSIRAELPYVLSQQNGQRLSNMRLQSLIDALVGVRTFVFMSKDGEVLSSNRPELIGRDFHDNERFMAIRQGANPATLYVSAPFRTPLGVYAMSVGKTVVDARGQFNGVLLAILDPDFFKILLNSVRYTPDTWSSVMHGDGKVVFSTQVSPEITGIDLSTKADSFFNQHLKSGQPTTLYSGIVFSTGEDRLVAFHTTRPDLIQMDKPLVIAISRKLPVIFANWHQQVQDKVTFFGLLVFVAMLGMFFYQRRQHAFVGLLISSEAEQKRSLERQRQQAMVFKSTEEGIVITDVHCNVIDANPAFERITEYALDDIRGQHMRFIASDRHDRAFYLSMWKSIAETGHWQGEIWNRRKSGAIYLEWLNISAAFDDQAKVINYIGVSIDISRMNHAQSELERQAHHDGLTDLPNRLLLMARLEHAVMRQKRFGGCGAVLFLDLDRFKQVNDTLGHKAGDELLRTAASRILARLRDVDTLGRLGGDEFVIVLEDISEANAAAVAQEIIGQLQIPFTLAGELQAHIGGSIGIAIFPKDGDVATELLERADQALYAAKGAGRGVHRFFSQAPSARA